MLCMRYNRTVFNELVLAGLRLETQPHPSQPVPTPPTHRAVEQYAEHLLCLHDKGLWSSPLYPHLHQLLQLRLDQLAADPLPLNLLNQPLLRRAKLQPRCPPNC